MVGLEPTPGSEVPNYLSVKSSGSAGPTAGLDNAKVSDTTVLCGCTHPVHRRHVTHMRRWDG